MKFRLETFIIYSPSKASGIILSFLIPHQKADDVSNNKDLHFVYFLLNRNDEFFLRV
jgi:hypothetical protein